MSIVVLGDRQRTPPAPGLYVGALKALTEGFGIVRPPKRFFLYFTDAMIPCWHFNNLNSLVVESSEVAFCKSLECVFSLCCIVLLFRYYLLFQLLDLSIAIFNSNY